MDKILIFATPPVLATIIGSAIALFLSPGKKMQNFMQHFTAGVVFSVVAVEILPDIIKVHKPLFVILGFGLGVATMMVLKTATSKLESKPLDSSAFPLAMLMGVCVDILLDGFLIGIGFAAGAKEGVLLASALTLELLSLGIVVSIELSEMIRSKLRILSINAGISSLVFIGAALGSVILSKASDTVIETVLSFGLAALLFLVTEELLVEAHRQPETPASTLAFFLGFLLFLVLGMMS